MTKSNHIHQVGDIVRGNSNMATDEFVGVLYRVVDSHPYPDKDLLVEPLPNEIKIIAFCGQKLPWRFEARKLTPEPFLTAVAKANDGKTNQTSI